MAIISKGIVLGTKPAKESCILAECCENRRLIPIKPHFLCLYYH